MLSSLATNLDFTPDIIVVLAYFAIIMGIGLWVGRRNRTVEEFALGNRSIPWWGVLASVIAAEISAATFLGAPESGYTRHNFVYVQFAIGTLLARIIVSFLFIPLYYRHGVISLYEFLEHRFGLVSRKFASATFLLTRVLAMGTRLYVAAIVLVLAVGLVLNRPVTASEKFWLFAGALVLITIMTSIYTSHGGIKAVVWTDFIQVGVLVAAIGYSMWFLLTKIGGWDIAVSHIKEPSFFDFAKTNEPGLWPWIRHILTSEYTIYGAVIGSTFVTMSTHGIDQDTVQRMLTAKTRKESAVATILSGVADFPIVGTFVFIGIMLHVYYNVQNPGLTKPAEGREVFPHFILTQMSPGLRGLVIAGILSTAMGSLSTALNALGTSFARDFVIPRMGDTTETKRIAALKWSTAFFAVLIIVVGLATAWFMAHNPKVEIIPLVLGILGFTFGSLLGIFLLAIFTKTRGNDAGNVIAMICGFLAVFLLSNPFKWQEWLFQTQKPFVLTFPWRITLGTFVTIAIAAIFRTPDAKVAEAEAERRRHMIKTDAR